MAIDYDDFIMLASLNTWPDDGLPDDYIVGFAVCSTEGDPRGNVTEVRMQAAFNRALALGWAELRTSSDGTDRIFAYPTEEGRKVFKENLDYWSEKATQCRPERRN